MTPGVGELVCDCRFMHQKIVAVDDDGDMVTLEDGYVCSYVHCCDPVPHPDFAHPQTTQRCEGD